jgi:hypothetical protein
MNFTDIEQKTKYTFVPDDTNIKWIDEALKNVKDKIFSNDIYEKYLTNCNIEGELIICKDYRKQDIFCKKVIKETYQQYLDFISKRDFKKEQWVYNILDGNAEQDKILYRDDKIIIIPNYSWNGKNNQKMHLLTFPTDKNLKSIRDLNGSHIELLKHCKNKTFEVIKNTYGFDKDIIKTFLHYAPSTYHLHIHFVLISNLDCA